MKQPIITYSIIILYKHVKYCDILLFYQSLALFLVFFIFKNLKGP